MAPEKNGNNVNRIPINFLDREQENDSDEPMTLPTDDVQNVEQAVEDYDLEDEPFNEAEDSSADGTLSGGGPEVAELVATRAELKRLEGEVKELKEGLARRQADFENYRKRVDRERSETYNRVVADIAAKLLPVLDNLKRALETEASVEASETDEFRHFLSGVDLIYKQLNGDLCAGRFRYR